MTGLLPAAIAVLLADFGGRGLTLAQGRRREGVAFVLAAVIAASAAAGRLTAPVLTPWAATLLIGIALLLAAVDRRRAVADVGTLRAIAAGWTGGAPLIAFALATRFEPVTTALGAAAGLAAAAATSVAVPLRLHRPLGLAAAALLGLTGVACVLSGLRLV